MLAALMGDFMGKVRRVEKRRIADDFYGEGHGQLFGFDAEIDAAILDQLLERFGRVLLLANAELALGNVLKVSFMGGMESFEQEQHPGDAAFEEGDAHPRKALVDAVV